MVRTRGHEGLGGWVACCWVIGGERGSGWKDLGNQEENSGLPLTSTKKIRNGGAEVLSLRGAGVALLLWRFI